MKLRTDFITNSSSTSFVVFGVDAECLKLSTSEEELEEEFDGSMREFINSKIPIKSVLIAGSAYCDSDGCSIVGITPPALLKHFPDRKIGEIPQIVADEIKKVFGVDINSKDVGYIEEASENR